MDVGHSVGLGEDEIAAVTEGDLANPARLGERERTVLEFTDAVLAGPKVDPQVIDAITLQFRDREIVELIMAVGTTYGLARLITVLQLDRDLESMA